MRSGEIYARLSWISSKGNEKFKMVEMIESGDIEAALFRLHRKGARNVTVSLVFSD